MENRRERRTTVTLGARAITLCSCSTSSVTARGRCSVRGTYIARTGGVMYWIRSCRVTGRQECDGTFVPMPHSPSRTSMSTWRSGLYAIRLPEQQSAAMGDRSFAEDDLWGGRRSVQCIRRLLVSCRELGPARRVVAKVEWHRGELFPRVGFIVTSMTAGPEGVVRFYNGRGTAEQWIKEGKYALNWTRLSCHRFVANRARLSLFVLAYNLGNFLRRLCLPKAVKHWSLRSVQVKLIKMGGRLVRHSRRLIFSVVRGVGSSTVVPGSVGSYRPVIAGAKLREGTTTILPRGRALQGVGLSSMRFHHTGGGAKTTKTDKKHGSRRESHPLLDRPEIDWPCRT